MQSSLRRRFFIPIVYVGAILLLLLVALFARSFSDTLGDARISGRFSPLPLFNARSLEELTLSWNGLSLRFSRAASPGLRGFEPGDGQADIVFADDRRLRLQASPADGTLSIVPVLSAGASRADLAIPFTVAGIVEESQQGASLLWREGGRSFQLALPAGARIDPDARSIDLPFRGAAAQSPLRLTSLEPVATERLAAVPAAPQRSAPARTQRVPDEKSLPTADQLAATIGHFVDDSYAGWASGRRSADDGLWKMPDGTSGFSEDIGAAYIAEAIDRGAFASAIQVWTDALAHQADRAPGAPAGPITSVYTGRVRDYVKAISAADGAETQQLADLVSRADPSLASIPGFERFILTRSGPVAAKQALAALLSKGTNLDVSGSLGLLEGMEDYAQLVGDDPSLPEKMRQLIDKRVLPSLTAADTNIFLTSGSGGTADVKLSIRAGSLLVRAGSILQDTRTAAIGRGLISSSLSLSTAGGFLPGSLTVAGGKVGARSGSLAPEVVYALLPLDRSLPHDVPLFRELGNGAWVHCSADVTTLENADGTVRLGFAYPTKVPYHLVFRGLKPFTQIRLHGIPWHADPQYANYSDGWSYDEDTRTLFMKITGKVAQEEVELRF